jgi:hypothetical protein
MALRVTAGIQFGVAQVPQVQLLIPHLPPEQLPEVVQAVQKQQTQGKAAVVELGLLIGKGNI